MDSGTRKVFTGFDSFLSHQGTDYEVYRKLGAHPGEAEGVRNLLGLYKMYPALHSDSRDPATFAGLYKRVFSAYDSLPGQGNPAEIGGIPPLTADWKECDGYSHRLTYSLRPFESVIFEFPT